MRGFFLRMFLIIMFCELILLVNGDQKRRTHALPRGDKASAQVQAVKTRLASPNLIAQLFGIC